MSAKQKEELRQLRTLLPVLCFEPEVATFPVKRSTIVHRDRPDFTIEALGWRQIGIETTAASQQVGHQASALLRRVGFPSHSFGGLRDLALPNASEADLLKKMSPHKVTWDSVDEMCVETVEKFKSRYHEKQTTFSRDDFDKFDINWLLVSELLHSTDAPQHAERYSRIFWGLLGQGFFADMKFDAVFFSTGVYLWKLTRRGMRQMVNEDYSPEEYV